MAFTHRVTNTAPLHRHDTVAQARECEQEAYEDYMAEQEATAEQAAEMAYERHLEDVGWEEAYAERQWEDARGVVQFEDALAMAEGRVI